MFYQPVVQCKASLSCHPCAPKPCKWKPVGTGAGPCLITSRGKRHFHRPHIAPSGKPPADKSSMKCDLTLGSFTVTLTASFSHPTNTQTLKFSSHKDYHGLFVCEQFCFHIQTHFTQISSHTITGIGFAVKIFGCIQDQPH